MKPIPLLFALLALIGFSIAIGIAIERELNPYTCPETLPTQVTDMFTIKGDTLVIHQGVNFTISTESVMVDSTGTIYRNR